MSHKKFLLFVILSCFVGSSASASGWLPLTKSESGKLYIPVSVESRDGVALLDTGASINVVSGEFLTEDEYDRRGDITIVDALGREEDYDVVSGFDVTIFGAELEFGRTVLMEGRREALILGRPFIEQFVFQFDYVNDRFRMIPRDMVDISEHANIRSVIDQDSGMPFVRVGLNEQVEAWLLLDTGAPFLVLDQNFAEGQSLLSPGNNDESYLAGVNSVDSAARFVVDEIKIGPFVIEQAEAMSPYNADVTITSRTRTGSRIRQPVAQGIVGADILQHFLLTIDYKLGLIHIAPGEPAH